MRTCILDFPSHICFNCSRRIRYIDYVYTISIRYEVIEPLMTSRVGGKCVLPSESGNGLVVWASLLLRTPLALSVNFVALRHRICSKENRCIMTRTVVLLGRLPNLAGWLSVLFLGGCWLQVKSLCKIVGSIYTYIYLAIQYWGLWGQHSDQALAKNAADWEK